MRLLSLEIEGFKSFADKTVIDFRPGMTGIIGPNGSGKSNIIEAIRWVMGEQSAKTLRGDKMADVIFNGAADRKPLNRAQVKITLDNGDHYLESEFTELTVTRRLYRNGDSEYLINDHPVRLKDIVDLFIDSGIGRESFSIISQGQVAAIFNGKPADRREVIETVAGVAKYKQNKKAAEKRLLTTNDNLNRVNDIIAEIEGRLTPLAEESALAEEYLEQRGRLDRLDRTQTVRQARLNQERLAQVSQQLIDGQDMTDQYDRRAKAASQRQATLQASRRQMVAVRDDHQAKLLLATQTIAKLENQQSLSSVRKEQRQAEHDRLTDRQTELEGRRTVLNNQLQEVEERINQRDQEIKDHQTQLRQLKTMSAEERAAQLTDKLEKLRNQQVDLMQEQTTIQNNQLFLKRDYQRNVSQREAGASALEAAKQKLADLNGKARDQAAVAQKAQEEARAVVDRYSQEQANQVKLEQQYEQTSRQWYQALGDVSSAESRIKSYRAMAADYTGYYHGVQQVLKHRQSYPGLFGAVSELIEVPTQYTMAIETVLGGQLQQLVVDHQGTGKQIIQDLIQTRGGRVTILPLDNLRGGYAPRNLANLNQLPGFIGRAGDLISFDPRFQIVVDHLLANTVVVDTLDNATQVARVGQHQVRVVTLDGQLINASGAMTGGANRNQRTGLLRQRQQLEELQGALQKVQATASQLEVQVKRLQEARQASQASRDTLEQELSRVRSEANQQQSSAQRLNDQVKAAKQEVTALEFQSNQQNDQQAAYQTRVEEANVNAERVEKELTRVKQETVQAQEQLTALQSNAASQNEQVHELSQFLAVAKARREQDQAQQEGLQTQLEEVQASLDEAGEALTHLAEQDVTMDAEHESSQSALAKAKDELKEHQEAVEAVTDQLDQLEEELKKVNQEAQRLQDLSKVAMGEQTRLAAEKAQLEVTIDQALNHLSERYQMTLDAASQDMAELADEELARQIKLLNRGIADLGDVNTASIAEYKQVKERYDFLSGQRADLMAAKSQLENTMAEMDQQVEKRFMTTFKQVSVAFSETFTQIFDGGEAKLLLTEPDQPLTTGVDITAQPPGKRNQRLSLLSGGERALTAIALLFAILKVRPVPFAILDEPEAALDAVNVDRFAHYLDRFGDQGPQFIVITHRKGTMMNADVLYGVTMQESGVSRMVSVDVNQTLEQHQA
jgi:chromosome segregation protein